MLDRDMLQRLYRYGYSLTGDRHRAYDLLQDAIEVALRKSPREPQSMLNYVRTIMRNRFIDEYRREKRHPVLSLEEQDDCPVDIDPRVLEEVVIAQHDLDVVIAVLDPMERELLFLWALEGYTAQELADQTGAPRGTVLARLHRLRTKILRHVGSDMRAAGEGGKQ